MFSIARTGPEVNMKSWMWVLIFAALSTGDAVAFERDVHFGLTKWLALQAGFSDAQAQAIGTGNQRVDGGDMAFMELSAAYACMVPDRESAANVQDHHYPSVGRVPLPPGQRVVVAGSAEALAASEEILKIDPGKAGFTLYKLGEALHVIQDSWSHRGIPEPPAIVGLQCDPALSFGHPAARGGSNSHRADLTWSWPGDTVAMAEASYRVLTRYPAIGGAKRTAVDWTRLRPEVMAFASVRTKQEKARWFAGQGISDVSFIAGTSLPDGVAPFVQRWQGDRLPELTAMTSGQHGVDADLLQFFGRFFGEWVTADDLDGVASRYGLAPPTRDSRRGSDAGNASQLAARMKVWRLRDHGQAAEIAHAPTPLTPAQLSQVSRLARTKDAYIRYPVAAAAFKPILPKTSEASPIVPYLVWTFPSAGAAPARAMAIVRFQHTPYDSVEVTAEKRNGTWGVASIAAVIEH
jgi:hypothetical protein